MRGIRGLALGLGLLPAAAGAMEIRTELHDLRPLFAPELTVHLTGEIVAGDAMGLARKLAEHDAVDLREISFHFDSPGGSVAEGLEIGRMIADRPEITSAWVGSEELPDAECASSCVYAFLGADYRNVRERGRIGVHRFSAPGMEMDGGQALAMAQELSGVILTYVAEMRADPALFHAMTATAAEDIHWIPRADLERWQVLNGSVYSETAEWGNIEGRAALDLQQVSRLGYNRLLLTCPQDQLLAIANLAEPEMSAVGSFQLVIDGEEIEMDRWSPIDRENNRMRAAFTIPVHLSGRLAAAKSVGVRATAPSRYVFFGFEQTIRDEKLRDMVGGCVGQASFDLPPMLVLDETDLPGRDLTSNGFRDVSFRQCQQLCIGEPSCEAVSYVTAKRWCWPKGAGGSPRPAPGVVSALRSGG